MGQLWGNWKVENNQTASAVVTMESSEWKPWLHIWPDSVGDDDIDIRNSRFMAERIAAFLNGGDRPEWLNDFEAVDHDCLICLSGAKILAMGPLIQADGGWASDESVDATFNRKLLIDFLLGPIIK